MKLKVVLKRNEVDYVYAELCFTTMPILLLCYCIFEMQCSREGSWEFVSCQIHWKESCHDYIILLNVYREMSHFSLSHQIP